MEHARGSSKVTPNRRGGDLRHLKIVVIERRGAVVWGTRGGKSV